MASLPDVAVDSALAVLQAGMAQDGCKLLVGLDAPRVLWANRNAESLFGTAERLALSRMVFGTASEGRPLATRLSRLEPGAPPRLEGVQVASRFRRSNVVFRCAAVPGSAPKMILFDAVLALRPRESLHPDAVPVDVMTDEPPTPTVVSGAPPVPQREAPPDPQRPAPITAGNPAPRFTWRTDRDGLVVQIGPEMQAGLGRTALQIGDNLENRLRAIGSPQAIAAADAIASDRGWPGVALAWPTDEAVVIVTLGGTPTPGGAGYRGFGLIQGRPPVAPPSDTAASEADGAAPSVAAENDTPAPQGVEDLFAGTPAEEVGPIGADTPLEQPSPAAEAPAEIEAVPQPATESDAEDPAVPEGSASMTTAIVSTARDIADEPGEPSPNPDRPARDEAPDTSSRVTRFPRAIESGTAKVVHLAAFKTGLAAFSGKAAIRRQPPPERIAEPPVLESPRWAETPEPDPPTTAPDQRLSSHERFNFDEIARALAALPLTEAGRAGETTEMAADAQAGHGPETQPPSSDALDLLAAIPTGTLIARGEQLLVANRALLEFVGYPDCEALERAGGLRSLFGSRHEATGDGRPERPLVARLSDGSEVEVHAAVRKISWGGQPAMLWTVRPAGGRETAAAATTPAGLNTADLAEALELAASGVGFLDGRGRLLTLNGGAERLLGYAARDLVGQDCGRLFVPDADEGWAAFFAQFAATAPARNSAYRKVLARTRFGDEIPLGVSLRRIGADRICMVFQQSVHGHATASELDLLRRDAERASALKSEFLAKISHEIRTPLNAMLGFTEIIIEERFGPIGTDRYRDYLKDIHASGTHVVSLVNDLLDLSRIEAGATELKLQPVDVNAVIGECVAAMQGQAYRDRVVMRSSLAACSPLALADDRSLRQIVLNLLSNAVKFNETGGQVILSTAISDSGRVLLRVRDTGPGMSESDIDTAMKPFRQLESAKAGAGTGLGLPLTKAMVEACQGSLRITSKPGDGTLVEVTLQRAPELPVSLPAE